MNEIFLLITIVLIIIIIFIIFIYKKLKSEHVNVMTAYDKLIEEFETYKKKRYLGGESSRIGRTYESISALFPTFPADWENDIVQPIMSGPVDFIIWKGFNNGDEPSILFVDCKTGKSAYPRRNAIKIRTAIQNHNVDFVFFVPDKNDGEIVPITSNVNSLQYEGEINDME